MENKSGIFFLKGMQHLVRLEKNILLGIPDFTAPPKGFLVSTNILLEVGSGSFSTELLEEGLKKDS